MAPLVNYLQFMDIVQFVVCPNILKVSLVGGLLETQIGEFTTPHAGVRVAAATSLCIENLTPPLNQVTHISQRVEQRGRPVAYVLIVELEPPIARLIILFSQHPVIKVQSGTYSYFSCTNGMLFQENWAVQKTVSFSRLHLTHKSLKDKALCKM
jgi:hypothetical protein